VTIGHSTRTLEEFICLLQAHGIRRVVDVRTMPAHCRTHNKTSLPESLKKAGLGYVHMPGLGGLRHAARDSINMGWRNASFRGYADYMQMPEFDKSLEALIQLVNQDRVALMCAEAVPWALSSLAHCRCPVSSRNSHRSTAASSPRFDNVFELNCPSKKVRDSSINR
jgi:uncharacterized protein (DUF488 family)